MTRKTDRATDQVLTVRNALQHVDPWKTISQIREANRGVDQKTLEADIRKAIKAVRACQA